MGKHKAPVSQGLPHPVACMPYELGAAAQLSKELVASAITQDPLLKASRYQ